MMKNFLLVCVLGTTALAMGCGDDDATGPVSNLDGGSPETSSPIDSSVPQEGDGGDGGDGGDSGPPSLPLGQVDRAGRVLSVWTLGDAANREKWNGTGVSAVATTFDLDLQNGLVKMDGLDGVSDYDASAAVASEAGPPDGGYLTHPLGKVLRSDVLIVDATKPFSPTGYLAIESALFLGGPANTGCGGRWMTDDAIDKQLSLLIKRTLTGVSDNVSAATKPPSETFPYLATPN